jgi:hypothetical protein
VRPSPRFGCNPFALIRSANGLGSAENGQKNDRGVAFYFSIVGGAQTAPLRIWGVPSSRTDTPDLVAAPHVLHSGTGDPTNHDTIFHCDRALRRAARGDWRSVGTVGHHHSCVEQRAASYVQRSNHLAVFSGNNLSEVSQPFRNRRSVGKLATVSGTVSLQPPSEGSLEPPKQVGARSGSLTHLTQPFCISGSRRPFPLHSKDVLMPEA